MNEEQKPRSRKNGNGSGGAGVAGGGSGPGGEPGLPLSPRKELLGIVERNESSFWTRIGAAFENRDGSWSLKFDYFPARGEIKIQMREPREPREREAGERA